MKRTLFATFIAAAAATALFASSDRIILSYSNGKTQSIWIDDIKALTFGKTDDKSDGYDLINIEESDGSSTASLNKLKSAEYRHGLQESRITMTVQPHHRCVSMFIDAPEGVYFRNGAIAAKRLENIPEREWIDYIYDVENKILTEVADWYGKPLSEFSNDVALRKGSGQLDWFPQGEDEDVHMPGSDYIAYIYEANIGPNGLEMLRDPYIVPFTAKTLDYLDIDFNIGIETRSNKATVKADAPENCGTDFAIEVVRKIEFEALGLERCIYNSQVTLMQSVYNGNKSWDEVLYKAQSERTYTNIHPDEEYVAIVYGCEYGEQTTEAVTRDFKLSKPEITDNCTFTTTTSSVSASEININVKPSNNSTRWVAMIKDSDYFTSHDMESYVVTRLYAYTSTGTINWTSSDFIHTGEATINSKSDVLDGLYFEIGTDYTLMIFGVDETGERTTEISSHTLRATSTQQRITFDVEVGDYNNSGATHSLPIKVIPSDPNAKYVLATLTDDGIWTELDDDDVMRDYAKIEGKNLNLRTGTFDSKLYFYPMGYNTLVFLYGYDGEPTSELYMWRVNSTEGFVTQLRGPKTGN